jgi:ribonuclease Y
MSPIIVNIFVAVFTLAVGIAAGYYIRQSLAKKRAGSLEAKLQKRVIDVKAETTELVKNAETKAADIIDKAQKEIDQRRREFLKAQQVLLDREKLLEDKISVFDKKEAEMQDKVEKLKVVKEGVDKLRRF